MGVKRMRPKASKSARYAKIIANKKRKMKRHMEKHPSDKQTPLRYDVMFNSADSTA